MHIVCPQCQAEYEVPQQATNILRKALLVCTSCRHEFTAGIHLFSEPEADSKFEPVSTQPDNAIEEIRHLVPASLRSEAAKVDKSSEQNIEKENRTAKRAGLLSLKIIFFITLLIGIIIAISPKLWQDSLSSFEIQIATLLSNDTTKSISAIAPISPFIIVDNSVKARWIQREDNSQALLISGTLSNKGLCSLAPPTILLTFTIEQQEHPISKKRNITISQAANESQLKHIPYQAPKRDTVPVAIQATRQFSFLLEGVDATARTFSLSPVASKTEQCL